MKELYANQNLLDFVHNQKAFMIELENQNEDHSYAALTKVAIDLISKQKRDEFHSAFKTTIYSDLLQRYQCNIQVLLENFE